MRSARRIVIMLIVTGVLLTGLAFAQSGSSTLSNESGSSTMTLIGVMPSQTEVRAVQEALRAKGYEPGRIDGVLGRKTASALKAFQNAEQLPVTGQVTPETRTKLGVEG
jgi:peptidoglycan hydrolase-like protein with peptidoglycan-binding domain